MTATDSAIRDRVLTLIEEIVPTSLSHDRFIRYRNEGDGDFHSFAQTAPQIRRFQVRDTGDEQLPQVSNTLVEEIETEMLILVAYPQNARASKTNALGRDDVMGDDWKAINYAIGIAGRGNFSGANDCTPLGCTKTIDRAGKVDFLTIKARFLYWRSTT